MQENCKNVQKCEEQCTFLQNGGVGMAAVSCYVVGGEWLIATSLPSISASLREGGGTERSKPSLPPGGRWHFAAGKMTEGVPGRRVTERKGVFLRVNSLDRHSLFRLIWITKQRKNRVYFSAYCLYPVLPQSRQAVTAPSRREPKKPPGGSLKTSRREP